MLENGMLGTMVGTILIPALVFMIALTYKKISLH